MKIITFPFFLTFCTSLIAIEDNRAGWEQPVVMGLYRGPPGIAMDNRQQQRRLYEENVRRGRQLLGNNETEQSPLYQAQGTHFSYIYVGTPPHRTSVIIDTGSHHTAFPCKGCRCGKKMNPMFDPKKSNTSTILTCAGGNRCYFSQSYSEGSSWHAYRVRDKLWMGGGVSSSKGSSLAVDFQFGCEDSETGLFRTQHVDGIMGMSATEDTLPHQLLAQKVTTTRVFALCFSNDGGVMTLGGFDTNIHRLPKEPIKFVKLIKTKGWFTVNLLDVSLRPSTAASAAALSKRSNGSSVSLGANVAVLNGYDHKGVIIDSGTTDTYLPHDVKKSFEEIFKRMTKITYSNNNMILSRVQYESLPVVVFTLEGPDGMPVKIECPPSSYAEEMGGGFMYAFRIYLTEASGAVLGANFMMDHNVIFDIDSKRVGFAQAKCKQGKKKQSMGKHLLQATSGSSNEEDTKGSRTKKRKNGRRRDTLSQ